MIDAPSQAGLDDNYLHAFHCGEALLAYRQGNFAAAIEWALRAAGDLHIETQVTVFAVVAMAQFRLQKPAEATAAFAQGAELARSQLIPRGSEDLGIEWKKWISAQALLTEAATVVGSGPTKP